MAASDSNVAQVDVAALAPLISCGLCKGYLRDPHTLCECLHTFCKVCLMRHLFTVDMGCPTCGVKLKGDPVANGLIKADQMLRGFVACLNPSTVAAPPAGGSGGPAVPSSAPVSLDDVERAKRRITMNSDAAERCSYMLLTLVRQDESQPLMPRPFLRTLAALQLQDLRAFIAARLVRSTTAADGTVTTRPSPCRPEEVQLFVGGAPVMGKEHTLQFVLKTQWRRSETLVVQYALVASD